MVDVLCPECGVRNWLENQSRCLQCGTVLRRCADCVHYAPVLELCQELRIEVETVEAQTPGALATSAHCRHYTPISERRAA